MMNILQRTLAYMARTVIEKHDPHVIAVTGSVGKTTTKEAIAHVLGSHFDLRKTEKNYNNELGLPLTIIGAQSGGRSLRAWFDVYRAWRAALNDRQYPQVLVLEYGIDRPGDMSVLTDIAAPHISVVTRIATAHREFFRDTKHIAREKGFLVENIDSGDNTDGKIRAAILNNDDPLVLGMKARTQRAVYTFGLGDTADIYGAHIARADDHALTFKLGYKERSIPVRLPGIISESGVQAVLAALSVAQICKVNLLEAVQSLETFVGPPSRMRPHHGRAGSLVIDDTYNASPESVEAALSALGHCDGRRIAVLGDMLELGPEEESSHRALARVVCEQDIKVLVCVGVRMRMLAEEMVHFKDECDCVVYMVDTPAEASSIMQKNQDGEDVVLVKGSQGMRMEKIVEDLIPESAHHTICRQDETWKKRLFTQP